MNKKIFGIKIGTILTFIICLTVAILIWAMVKYQLSLDAESASLISDVLRF